MVRCSYLSENEPVVHSNYLSESYDMAEKIFDRLFSKRLGGILPGSDIDFIAYIDLQSKIWSL